MAKNELDQLYITNPTAEAFTVKWGGIAYTLQPGEQKIWMRFLAEHFAKHLTNSILLKKEKAHKDEYLAEGRSEKDYMPKSFVNSRALRPQTIDSILVGVYSYHQGQSEDPNAIIQQQIDQLNPQQQSRREKEMDLGDAADPLYGVLKNDKPDPVEAAPAPQPVNMQPQPGASMIPGADTIMPPAAQPAPQEEASSGADGRTMKELMAEAKKLDITIPFGSNKDQVREMIRKQYA